MKSTARHRSVYFRYAINGTHQKKVEFSQVNQHLASYYQKNAIKHVLSLFESSEMLNC